MSILRELDVAFGIIVLYLLLAFLASACTEIIATIGNWRARMLHDAIGNMLQTSGLASVDDVYNHPLIRSLGRQDAAKSWVDLFERMGWRPGKVTQPSYIPAAMFSACILQCILQKSASRAVSPEKTAEILRTTLFSSTKKPSRDDALASVLETTLAVEGSNAPGIRLAIEKWCNDTMDRTTGWYKRRTQS